MIIGLLEVIWLKPIIYSILFPPAKAGGNTNASNKFNDQRETIFLEPLYHQFT